MNLTEWRDSGGAVIMSVDSGGRLVNKIPYSSAVVTSNSANTSGTTELVLASAPAITADGSTQVVVEFDWYNITLGTPTDVFLVKLYDGPTAGSGTQIGQWLLNVNTNGGSGHMKRTVTPSAGSHTYTARLVRSAGTGTAQLFATATAPAEISVRQAV